MKVLIAEDDAVSSFVLAARVRKMGHDVLTATDGNSAWTIYQREHPRLVITDWMMPEMDGLELCRRIRSVEHRAYTYVILLTALSGRERYFEGMKAGADDFVTKPFNPAELTLRVNTAGTSSRCGARGAFAAGCGSTRGIIADLFLLQKDPRRYQSLASFGILHGRENRDRLRAYTLSGMQQALTHKGTIDGENQY